MYIYMYSTITPTRQYMMCGTNNIYREGKKSLKQITLKYFHKAFVQLRLLFELLLFAIDMPGTTMVDHTSTTGVSRTTIMQPEDT